MEVTMLKKKKKREGLLSLFNTLYLYSILVNALAFLKTKQNNL